MVTDEERDYMYQVYATDPLMRLNVGIRRRLAPLMENSRRRVELLNVLLFTLPGTPIVYYGDELGMGDNIYLGDRNGVRTPMQWSGDRNAGFSRADPARLYAPPIMDPVYGYQSINVEAQQRYPFSLLNCMKRMIAFRKRHPVLGRGVIEFVGCPNRKVLAYVRRDDTASLLVVCNLSRYPQPASLDLSAFTGLVPVEMLGETEFPRITGSEYPLTLGPYGSLVFRLQQAVAPVTARPVVREPAAELAEVPALLAGVAWDTLLDGALRRYLERDVLVGFLRRQRWAATRGSLVSSARFIEWGALRAGQQPVFLTVIESTLSDGRVLRSTLPLAAVMAEEGAAVQANAPSAVVARITGARKGLLLDATGVDRACDLLLDLLTTERTIAVQGGTVRGRRTAAWLSDPPESLHPITRPGTEQRQSTIHYGTRKVLRVFRELDAVSHPMLETALHLAAKRFDRVPPLAGWIEYEPHDGATIALGVLEGLVRNQGDAWSFLLEELRRYYETAAVGGRQPGDESLAPSRMAWQDAPPPEEVRSLIGLPLPASSLLGRRTAELHRALAAGENPDFAPLPFAREALEDTIAKTREKALRAAEELASVRADLDPRLQARLDGLDGHIARLDLHADRLQHLAHAGARIRVHGDLHLAHILWVEHDFVFVATGSDPALPPEERRVLRSPLTDVATLVRSFGYAAAVGLLAIARQQPAGAAALASWAAVWGGWMGAAFLSAYRTSMADTGLVPADAETFAALLQWFLIDRAFDELAQEARHRAELLDIPLSALEQLLA
jgi:maltose alpha-D-glucosyltransferase/alpha-amylase